ncbi:unnamed protein product [Allacma fusca]|uniref:Knr4/Smi1-like domain-containing protein n=1 Tax=Allacma fusca TaxID=39272 RepID=A0A8J2PAY4_9HEXA|nr:unnamed protein product [Allacma fusca]
MLPTTEFSFDTPEPEPDPSLMTVNQAEQRFHNQLTLGIEQKLKENRMIKDVKLIIRKPVDKLQLSSWERKHCLSLPQDLRDYYLSTNGFRLVWSLEHAGDILRIGDMNVNSINNLTSIEKPTPTTESMSSQKMDPKKDASLMQMSFSELQQIIATTKSATLKPNISESLALGLQGKAFRLDSNRSGWGTVCLVYPKGNGNNAGADSSSSDKSKIQKPQTDHCISSPRRGPPPPPQVEVWFMDPSCQWHFLAPTFTHYYRMLLIHLGLPQWQYRFTPFGLSAWAEQMFWIVAPQLLQQPKISPAPSMYTGMWSPDIPPEAATPNTTTNVITMNLFRKKKKDKPGN